MTYGSWLADARRDLHVAAALIADSRGPGGTGDALAAVAARRATYRGLARHVALLSGSSTALERVSIGRVDAVLESAAHPPIARLHAGLTAAAAYEPGVHSSQATTTGVVALARAANAIAVAADILGGHVQADPRTRTAEGAAIRAGGGVAAALADIARLTLDALAVDDTLRTWLRAAGTIADEIAARAVGSVRGSLAVDLHEVANQIVIDNADAVPLLHSLHVAPATGQPPRGATNAEEAAVDFLAARDWLWQNQDRLHGAHLRVGTRVGLAVSLLAARVWEDGHREVGHWRSAAGAAAEVFGSPLRGEAAHSAEALAGVQRWATDLLSRGQTDVLPAEEPAAARRLAAKLPMLASALAAGIPSAVRRGELVVRVMQLGPIRAGIRRVTPTYRRAVMGAAAVSALARSLQLIEPARVTAALQPASDRESHARRAFPGPPRPSAPELAPPTVPPIGGRAVVPRRGR